MSQENEKQSVGERNDIKQVDVEQSSNEQNVVKQNDVDQNSDKQDDNEQESNVETQEQSLKQTKKSKKKWVLLAVVALLAVVLIAYGSVAIYFQTHFLPGTRVNGMDCSQLEIQPVADMVEQQAMEYELIVTGRDVKNTEEQVTLGTISAESINLQLVDIEGAISHVMEQQDELLWPLYYMGQRVDSYSIVQGVTFDEEMLEASVKEWEAFQKKNMIAPKDAYISDYSEEKGGYELIQEVKGTTIDVEAALVQIANAITGRVAEINLDEKACYVDAKVTVEDADLQKTVDAANKCLESKITYDWNGTKVELGKEQIKEWITVANNKATLDEEAIAEFVTENAQKWDTYGKNRNFMTTLGVELNLPSGAFGWLTDKAAETEELIALIKKGETTEREPIYSVRGFRKGNNDIGNSYVEIDLTHQHLYVYIGGAVVFETDFVSGLMTDPGCVTPAGVFGLTYKTTNAVLRGADYEEPVSFWMPFHGNYGMHDATWRTEFGGDIYLENGSHGCINLPLEAAGQIYGYVYDGFPIICYYY